MEEVGVILSAVNNASPELRQVFKDIDDLRKKYEDASNQMAQGGGIAASFSEIEKAIKSSAAAMMNDFMKGASAVDAAMVRIATAQAHTHQLEQEALIRADAANARSAEHSFFLVQETQQKIAKLEMARWDAALKNFEANKLATARWAETTFFYAQELQQKLIALNQKAADDKAAQFKREVQASIKAAEAALTAEQKAAAEKRALFVSEVQAKIKEAERLLGIEKKSAEDTFFLVQGTNQDLIALTAKRVAAEEAAASKIAAAHAREASTQMKAAMGGGGMGGVGGLGGGGGPNFGAMLGGAAGGAGRALEGLLGAGAKLGSVLLTPVTAIASGFSNMIGHINGAASSLGHMVMIGVGVVSLYEIVNTLERAFAHIFTTLTGFQDKMVQTGTLTESTAKNMDDMGAAVLDSSMKTGQGAVELGQALFFIKSHGIEGADALLLLDKAAMLAASGLGTTDQIVRVVAGQMRQYGVTTEQAAVETGHFMDVFARTEQLSSLPIGELSKQMARITPLAAALNVPIEQVGAAIAQISRSGLPASRVLTDLIAVFTQLIKTTPKQVDALKGMGTSIEEVRKTLVEKGFFEAMTTIWEKSGHDIDAVGKVFGDTSRSLIGYLALVSGSGAEWEKILGQMNDSAGTTAKVFEATQVLISRQVNRSRAIFEAYGIVVSNQVLPGVAMAWEKVNNAMQAGDIMGAFNALVAGASQIATGVTKVLNDLATSMFGSGVSLISELAAGMWEAATTILQQVANAVADLIASFLLGASPTKAGPLHYIREGVLGWNKEYASAQLEGGQIIAGAAARVAETVNGELAKIGNVQAAGTVAGVTAQIHAIEEQLLPWQQATDTIKNHYEAMLHPLERQIASIEHIKNLEHDRKQLVFEQRDMELQMLKIRAEGDPAKRAKLAGDMAKAQEIREQHSIDSQMASLNRRLRNLKPGKGVTGAELAMERRSIQDEMKILGIQKQQHALTNATLLGQYETGKAKLDYDKAGEKLANDAFNLEKKKTLQPLIEQRDKIKTQMQTELDIIALQTDGLEDQRKILQSQLKLLQDRERGSKTAGGIGAHPFPLPGDDIALDGEGAISKAMSKVAHGMAEQLKMRLQGGMEDFWREVGPGIGQGAIGFIVGGMVFGLPGALVGAAFVPKLVEALTERGITSSTFESFVVRVQNALSTAFTSANVKLQAGDLLGSAADMAASIGKWMEDFQTLFFKEWATVAVQTEKVVGEGPQGYITKAMTEHIQVPVGTEGSTRFTGPGRTMIEKMFGPQEAELNFQLALELINTNVIVPVGRAIEAGIASLFAKPLAGLGPEGQELYGRSIAEKVSDAIGDAFMAAPAAALRIEAGLAHMLAQAMFKIEANAEFMKGVDGLGQVVGRAMGKAIVELPVSLVTNAELLVGMFTLGHTLGIKLGIGIAKGLYESVPLLRTIGGIITHDDSYTPGVESRSAYQQFARPPIETAGPPDTQIVSTGAGMLPEPEVATKLGGDTANGILEGYREAWANSQSSFADENTAFWKTNVIDTANDALQTSSPSRVFEDIGEGVLEGFGQAFQQDFTTAAIIRMWARSEVIEAARTILIRGEGKGGGFGGIAQDAIDAFSTTFGMGVPADLANNLNTFGRSIVSDIMDPIKDPQTGIAAELRKVYASLPKAPPPGASRAPNTLPTPGAGERYAATGADFVVGGSGGTDSQNVRMWLTPGERVQVGSAATSTGNNGDSPIHVNINSPLIQVANMSPDTDLDSMLDKVQAFIISDIRTARGAGVGKPGGVSPRGAR